MHKHPILANLLLSLATIALVFVLAEGFLRAFYPVKYRRPAGEHPEYAFRHVFNRRSSIPGLAYELTPNREGDAVGAHVKTNSYGMRDDEPLPPENSTVRRLVAIGDSYTFGFGVEGNETWPSVLE